MAEYHIRRGYEGDAKCIREGRADYSTDVQSALVAVIMCQDGLKGPQAAIRAYFIPSEAGSESKPLCEKEN